IADGGGGLTKQAGVLSDERVVRQGVVRDRGPDDELPSLLADLTQAIDLAQVHQQLRSGHPHPQHRHQRLPAANDLRVIPAVDECLNNTGDVAWSGVVEGDRPHWVTSSFEPRASWRADHTFTGVTGIVMSLTPRGRRASRTPLTMAGGAAVVPVSPTALTPRVFVVASVTVYAVR